MDTIEFNIYSVNKSKEQINFVQSVKFQIELKAVNYLLKIMGSKKEKIVVKDCKVDGNSFDEASEKIEYLDLGDNEVLVFCKFKDKSYLVGNVTFEDDEIFDPERFLKLLLDDFLEEISR